MELEVEASAMPYGADWLENRARQAMSSTESEEARTILSDMQHQRWNWQKHLAVRSQELCQNRGEYLRDVIKISEVRGETDPFRLMWAGAQYVLSTV